MAVYVQGRAGIRVAQPFRDGDNIGSAVNQDAGRAVPLWHNKDKSENPVFARGRRFVLILFPLKIALKMGVKRGGEKAGLHIKDKFLDDVKEGEMDKALELERCQLADTRL